MTIERIKSQHAQSQTRARLALGVLQWLSTVQRQITASELQHAIAVSRLGKNERNLDLEDLTNPTFFVDCCFGLVVIDGETSIIRLVHFSVNEFLQEQRGVLFDDPDGDLAACCLAYITACATSLRRRAVTVTLDELSSKWTLWQYATQHWGVHARTCSDQRVMDRLAGFFSVSTALELWSRHLALAPALLKTDRDDDAEWLVAARFVAQKTTPLHIAAIYGIYELAVNSLAKNPTCLNAKDEAGATPLMLAAANGSTAVVELLMSKDAIDLNVKDHKGGTALVYAVRSTQVEMVRQLVSRHPQLNINSADVINMACNKSRNLGSTDASVITALLLDHPAFDLLAQTPHASTDDKPWYSLAVGFNLDNLRSLLGRPDFDAWLYSWPSSERDCVDSLNYLLNSDYGDHDAFASLVTATSIALLLDKTFPDHEDDFMALQVAFPMVYYAFGPYVLSDEERGQGRGIQIPHASIWDDADETGRDELREALERDGISLDSTDSLGKGFLHFVAYSIALGTFRYMNGGHADGTKYVQYLISQGTPIDIRDHKGRTPLHFAARHGSEEAVQLFIDAGADPLAADNSGLTALHYATESTAKSLSLVSLLLKLGADIGATSTSGDSVLHHAAQHGADQKMMIFLIMGGAPLTSKTRFGETAVMQSTWGSLEALRTLLDFGADPLETTPSFNCALTRAVLEMNDEQTKACLEKVEKAEDLSGPKCLGMSILDYLSHFDRAVATELGFTPEHWAAYVPTPPEERKLNVMRAIGTRLEWTAGGGEETAKTLSNLTAYLLIQAGDDEAARIMTEQFMEPKSRHPAKPSFEYECSNCHTKFTPQFRCRVCPWVNFCGSCVVLPPEGRDEKRCYRAARKCVGHGFFEYGGEQWGRLPAGQVNEEGQTLLEYVKDLQRKYPPPDAR